jgi:hypothetical protein
MELTIELIKGQPYMVKHRGSLRATRRIYKHEEVGVCNIKRYVFSAKVKNGVYADVEEVTNKNGVKTGVCFFRYKNTQTLPSQEISIPYYDIIEISPIN